MTIVTVDADEDTEDATGTGTDEYDESVATTVDRALVKDSAVVLADVSEEIESSGMPAVKTTLCDRQDEAADVTLHPEQYVA